MASTAKISFASAYGDHMVLQQAPQSAMVWGFAPVSASKVMLALACCGSAATTLDANLTSFNSTAKKWTAKLPATSAKRDEHGHAVAYSLTATSGGATTRIDDILFGEVWVCSGQSNMAFLLEMDIDGKELVQEANTYPEIRFMTATKRTATTPRVELEVAAPWAVSSNVSVSDKSATRSTASPAPPNDDPWLWMSAVCWMYGRELHRSRHVPVGLINSNWGGSWLEDWSTPDALAKCTNRSAPTAPPTEARASGATYGRRAYPPADGTGIGGIGNSIDQGSIQSGCHPGTGPPCPSLLWNSMIHPLIHLTIRGAIWYQGESNSMHSSSYACQLYEMVGAWRRAWHLGSSSQTPSDFPFGIVQLSAVVAAKDNPLGFVLLRHAQAAAAGLLPPPAVSATAPPVPAIANAFLVPTFDLGDAASPFGSVHTRYKQDMAIRLGRAARVQVYGEKKLTTPPQLISAHAESDGVHLMFSVPLSVSPMTIDRAHQYNWTGQYPFEICDDDTSTADLTDEDAPCALTSGLRGWRMIGNIDVRDGGRTLVLSGTAPPAAAPTVGRRTTAPTVRAHGARARAVRFAWRAYPCERLGCGVYAAPLENVIKLPPPPFHVML